MRIFDSNAKLNLFTAVAVSALVIVLRFWVAPHFAPQMEEHEAMKLEAQREKQKQTREQWIQEFRDTGSHPGMRGDTLK
jgi:hypothetical protein